MKIMFSFFLLILYTHSVAHTPASWAVRHTTVCLDVITQLEVKV